MMRNPLLAMVVLRNNKHFDTKVVFLINGQKAVMHGYNSTQNLKFDGSAHPYFLDNFLQPFFKEQIEILKAAIDSYDKKLVSSIVGKSGPVKGKLVKKLSVVCKNQFECNVCHN